MFLNAVQRRNPGLLEAALKLHRDHRLPPNTYVLDLDGLEANARALAAAARAEGLSLYFMTKQLNRNPRVMQTVAAAGITRGVAVDIDDARAFRQAGVTLGHVGHLVQIPRAHLPQVLSWRPEVMTVFSLANARAVSEAAVALGRRQDVLLRLAGQEVFPGQEGGVDWDDLPSVAREVVGLPGVRLAGLTAFPCLLAEDGRPTPTPNLALLSRAARLLRDDVGLDIGQVNAPSLTCCSTLPLLRQAGATHGEPGHALTGSTPLHAVSDQPEVPALLYLSEVSHRHRGVAYCFGGGTYSRGHLQRALVGTDMRPVPVQAPEPEHIDYYLALRDPKAEPGEPVLMAFRTQAFTARANLALVAGIRSGRPRLAGLFDRGNQPLDIEN